MVRLYTMYAKVISSIR